MKNHKAIWSFIATALVFQACSSNKASFPPAGDFYEKQQLQTFFQATNQQKVVDDEYYIEIGDVLDIVFPLFKDLTTERLIVRRDGRISLPYLGDVRAAGRTPMELDSTLTSRFARILKTPELSVIVRESAEHLIYVMGEVARPGGFKHDGPISPGAGGGPRPADSPKEPSRPTWF